jgi:hypothetical protein
MATKSIIVNDVRVGEYEASDDQEADARKVHAALTERGLLPKISRQQAIYNHAVMFAKVCGDLHATGMSAKPWNPARPSHLS